MQKRHANSGTSRVTLRATNVAATTQCNTKCTPSVTSSQLQLCKHCESSTLKQNWHHHRCNYQLTCTCNAYFTLKSHHLRGSQQLKFQERNKVQRCRHNSRGCHCDADNCHDRHRMWAVVDQPASTRQKERQNTIQSCQLFDENYS
jgi:hypothetical protein